MLPWAPQLAGAGAREHDSRLQQEVAWAEHSALHFAGGQGEAHTAAVGVAAADASCKSIKVR